jgi:hypothetical protein
MMSMSVLPAARVVRGGDAPAHLQPAPRRVPARLVWRLLFGSPIGIFGWCFVAFGMGFILASVPRVEFVTPDHDRETTATIMLVTPTGASENDQPIYRVDYVFTDATGAVMSGTSYTKDPTVHGTQRVEYVAADPSRSRLEGMRSRPHSWWVLVVVVVFPLVGLGMALPELRTGLAGVVNISGIVRRSPVVPK